MSNINKAAVLNPFTDLTANILDYVPRATTSEFGIVAIGSGINVDNLGRIYLDTQEYSDRLTAIETQAASSLATQQTAISAAIAQVNLTQSQTITALTLEVSNLKTNLTNSITATQTDLINRADQLAQDVTDITVQLTQDKATFTQEIQDALDYLKDDASVASALRTPRKINGVAFDGTQDITLPLASTSVSGTVQLNNTLTSTNTGQALTAAQGKVLNDSKLAKTENAVSASKLQTSRTISLTGGVTGSVSFDGSANASIATTVTGLGVANGIATLDSSGQVPSTQLPSYVDDVLEYLNVAAFPTTGESGKIYVETTGNTTYRWSGTGYVKITSGEVSSVAGKTGVVTLTKADVGLPNVDNTADSSKSVASAAKLTTARAIGGIAFDGTANISLPGVNTAGNQNTSGNAGSASKLATARTLTVGRTGKAFDGSINIAWTATEVLPTATSGQFLKFDGTTWIASVDNDTTYSAMSQAEANTGTDTANRVITAAVLKEAIQTHAPAQSSSITGNAASATKLETARTLSWSGDATGSLSFDGSANVSTALTLANSGVTAGTYKSVTVDAKGRVTAGNDVITGLITSTTASGTANVATGNTNTFLNITEKIGTNTSTVGSSSQITGAGTVTVASDAAGKITITGSQTITGNAATATKLTTARTINGTNFDGSTNITTTNWGTARTLTIGSSGKSVNGSANVSWTLAEIGAAAASHTHAYLPLTGGTLNGELNVTGSITATGNITAFSDARLKDNITKIPDALNKLNQLKGVTYTRKDLASDTQYAGLIAQDVQKVLPEAVAVNKDAIISVDYNGVIGLLVEAIKELESKVAILEGK